MRRMEKWFANPAAAILLVVSNLVPLAGVLFWDWDVGSIVMLYWSENVILGVYILVKMIARAPIGGWLLACSSAFTAVGSAACTALVRRLPGLA